MAGDGTEMIDKCGAEMEPESKINNFGAAKLLYWPGVPDNILSHFRRRSATAVTSNKLIPAKTCLSFRLFNKFYGEQNFMFVNAEENLK